MVDFRNGFKSKYKWLNYTETRKYDYKYNRPDYVLRFEKNVVTVIDILSKQWSLIVKQVGVD